MASPSSIRACPGPQSWRALVDRLKRAGYKPKRRAHRRRHPLAPRPLRRRRADARHLRRRGHHPPQLPHLVRPTGGGGPRPRRGERQRSGAVAVRTRHAVAHRRGVPAAAQAADADAVLPSGDAPLRPHARTDAAHRRRRGRHARHGASGWRCTRRATRTTTSACSTPPTASSSPATTCCPRSRPTSRGSSPAPTRSTSSSRASTRSPASTACSSRSPPTATRSTTSPAAPTTSATTTASGSTRCGPPPRSSATPPSRSTATSSSSRARGARWPRARPTPTSSTSARPARSPSRDEDGLPPLHAGVESTLSGSARSQRRALTSPRSRRRR